VRKLGFACKFGSSRTGIEFMHLIAERVDLHQRPAWLCVFLNSRIAARATVAGSGGAPGAAIWCARPLPISD